MEMYTTAMTKIFLKTPPLTYFAVLDPQVPNGSPPVPSRPFSNQRFAIPLAAAVIGVAAFLIFMWRRSSR